jgi:Amt family ammonium transporter
MLWIGGLIFIFGMLLQAILKRMLSDPLRHMVSTAQSVIQGEDTSFDTSRRDEFGFLARFINKALETLKHRQQELSYQASHDNLTGIHNRSEFDRRLQHALERFNTEGVHYTLCYLDLDQFKIINDTCGHIAGDELLRQITQTLKSELRESDFISRLGGDEFGIILSGCDETAAVNIAEKIREAVSKFHFNWEGRTFQIGVSIGVVSISDPSDSCHHLLSSADVACYAAKEKGRNQVHVYEPDDKMLERKRGEMQWATRIKHELAENGFQLYCQSMISVSTDNSASVPNYEILLRAFDEDGNLTLPQKFLGPAEHYGLMPDIDVWVIKNTFSWMQRHAHHNANFGFISINLSGQSLSRRDFLDKVISLLHEFPVDPEKVCFEITETSAIANIQHATKFIRLLKGMGCQFALDDFGSGMSSFAYLKQLPIDYLKIDGSYVRDIVNDPVDRSMVEAVHQIGHAMGLKTVAEFVESQDILDALNCIGVDYAQGFYVSRPVPLEDLFANTRKQNIL